MKDGTGEAGEGMGGKNVEVLEDTLNEVPTVLGAMSLKVGDPVPLLSD